MVKTRQDFFSSPQDSGAAPVPDLRPESVEERRVTSCKSEWLLDPVI